MTKNPPATELAAEFIGSMLLVAASISSMVMFYSVFDGGKAVAVRASHLLEPFIPFSR